MIGLEDNVGNIGFWRAKLEAYEEWNSLPNETRKRLLNDLKMAANALAKFHISEQELLDLATLTSIPTVFDSIITTATLPNLDAMNNWELKAYLRRVVLNSEKGKMHEEPIVHSEKSTAKRKQGKLVTKEYLEKHNPYDFRKHFCKFCGERIRRDNVTCVCIKCQKKGRNGN